MKLRPLISELIVTDLSPTKQDKKLVIVWKDKMFLFDVDSDLTEIINHLQKHAGFDFDPEGEDGYDLISYIGGEMPPDVLSGEYYLDDKTFRLLGMGKSNPITSTILKKVLKYLDIKKFTTYDEDDEISFSKKKNIGDIPSIIYHGTNTENLPTILKFGLEAGRGKSNFGHRDIYHEKEVFFAASFHDAKFYANNAIYDKGKSRQYEKIPGIYPVILEFTVPDRDKVVPDFDAELSSKHQRHYDHPISRPEDNTSDMKPMALSKEIGKFGYSGRIPASFIKWVYIFRGGDKKWMKFRPKTVYNNLMNYDSDWYYRIGVGL